MGYLFQNYALFPNMTVRQNILCGLCREKDRGVKETRLREMLRLMQLEGLENHKPHQLSGGQQQRVALARILVSEPKLLLLDEPFSALDGHLRDALKIELRDLLERFGREVLMVTHDRNEAYNMSREIAVMDRGALPDAQAHQGALRRPRQRAGRDPHRLQEHRRGQARRRAHGGGPRMGRPPRNEAARGGGPLRRRHPRPLFQPLHPPQPFSRPLCGGDGGAFRDHPAVSLCRAA